MNRKQNKTLISCPNSITHVFWAEFVVKSHQQSDWISVQSVAVVESGCSLTNKKTNFIHKLSAVSQTLVPAISA